MRPSLATLRCMELETCARCMAQVKRELLPAHNRWHVLIEPGLEVPTSDFGFWDDAGRWNPNSRAW